MLYQQTYQTSVNGHVGHGINEGYCERPTAIFYRVLHIQPSRCMQTLYVHIGQSVTVECGNVNTDQQQKRYVHTAYEKFLIYVRETQLKGYLQLGGTYVYRTDSVEYLKHLWGRGDLVLYLDRTICQASNISFLCAPPSIVQSHAIILYSYTELFSNIIFMNGVRARSIFFTNW